MSTRRTFLALVALEWTEHRWTVAAAAGLGLAVLATPLLPGLGAQSPAAVREAAVLTLVVLFGGTFLLALGANLFGRDLSEGRLGFYLVRPVPGWVLWTARVTAAWTLVLAVLAALLLPTLAVDGVGLLPAPSEALESRDAAVPLLAPVDFFYASAESLRDHPRRPPPALLALATALVPLGLLLAVHGLSILVRSRSSWLLLDVAALAVAGGLVLETRDLLLGHQAWGPLVVVQRLLLPWLLVALLAAGGVQIARGRSHLVRGHGLFSAVFWTLAVVASLALFGYARWVVDPDLGDLDTVDAAIVDARGEHLVLGGVLAGRSGYAGAFLLGLDDPAADSPFLGGLDPVGRWLSFSEDGRVMVWGRCRSYRPFACRLWRRDLDAVEPAARPTAVEPTPSTTGVVLSPRGDLAVLVEYGRLSVHALADGQLLASAGAPYPSDVSFPAAGVVRFHVPGDGNDDVSEIRELDLASRRVETVGRLPGSGHSELQVRGPGDLLVYFRLFPKRHQLRHARTGARVRDLDGLVSGQLRHARFLADGRLLLHYVTPPDRHRLAVLDSPDAEPRVLPLPSSERVVLGAEPVPGRLRLGLEPDDPAEGWRTVELDLATAKLLPIGDGVRPLALRGPVPPPGSPASRLVRTTDHAVVDLPADGDSRPVLAPSRRPR